MIKPTIHLNGTDARTLAAGYERVANLAHDLIEALAQNAPNGRDYYPQGPFAVGAAVEEHFARIRAVRKVHEEIMALWDHAISS